MKIFKLTFVFMFLIFAAQVFGQKLKAEDVLAKHLDSIGTAENRTAIKNLFAVGAASVRFISRKDVPVEGRIVLASAGEKSFIGMNLNTSDYPSERIVSDGKNITVAFIRNGVRSALGGFIQSNGGILKESIFGGTLSTSWAVLNTTNKKPKISFEGVKKIDGKEAYVLNYSPKGGSDIDISLYFDKETFRHVRTEYKRITSAGIGTRPEQSSGFSESRLKVVEDFADFKVEKNLTLPHTYKINYSLTGQAGTTEIEWIFNFTDFTFNQNLDPKTFDVDSK